MPPEPVPCDRKDFVYRDRKQERSTSGDALGGGSSTQRWRDPYHVPRASPRRPPPSCHRQSVSYYQLYDERNGLGCTPSRSYDGFRSSNGRYNGGRSSCRESRGPLRLSPYHDGYESSHVTSHRSVAVPITSPSPPSPLKDLQNKHHGGDDQSSDQPLDQDRDHSLGSIGWKPMKWSRHGSISSSNVAGSEVEEAVNKGALEVSVANLGKETPLRSPVSSPAPLDDGVQRKKSRLTWGQGLAKYEKQKVEGSAASEKDQASESSMKVNEVAGSMSPVTPCSAACPSPGAAVRPFSKAANVDKGHHSKTYTLNLQNCAEEQLPVKIDQSTLISLLNDLFQPEDVCTGDSTPNRNTAINKLILFKADVSKELEKTESEIDLLENELKSLIHDGEGPRQISLALRAESTCAPCLELVDVSSKVPSNSTPVNYSSMMAVEEPVMPASSFVDHDIEAKNADNDTPHSSNNGNSALSGIDEPPALDRRQRAVIENGFDDLNHLDAGCSSGNGNLDMISHDKIDGNLIDAIMASNRDSAKKASHFFDGALQIAQQQFDIWGSDRILACRKNDMHIKGKLTMRNHQLKFKERVLSLKFRALHHLWKEDLRLLSVTKQRPKSQKRSELCSRSSQSSSQKNRFSLRSRFTLPAGNSTLVPTADIVDFTSRMLTDSQIKPYRIDLKMPALILDETEKRHSRFITRNNLIEDPYSYEKEMSMINSWTQEEKRVFLEMLATYGKDFGKISSFLSHKTTADCIEFYYKNHKSEIFRDVKKQLDLRKQWRPVSTSNNYLVASGKKWSHESNAASLDILGAVSVAIACNHSNTENHKHNDGRSIVPSYQSSKVSRASYSSLERPSSSSLEISGYEKETAGADVLAEAVSSCVTSSISPLEKMRPTTPEITQIIEEEDTCSDEACGELDSVDWTDEEKSMFIKALSLYGKDFVKISHCVGTKSREQCKIFFSKARKCLNLDRIHIGAGNGGAPISDANGGGRSDTDDACAAEIDSAICSTQSCSRMDVGFNEPVVNMSNEMSSEQIENERGILTSPLKHSELVSHDGADIAVDRGLQKADSGDSVEPASATCAEIELLKPQATVSEVELQHVQLVSEIKSGAVQQEIDSIDKNNDPNVSSAAESRAKEYGSCANCSLNQQPMPIKLLSCSQKKSQMLLAKHDHVYSVSTVLPDPSFVCSEGSTQLRSQSILNFNEHLHNLHQGESTKTIYQQCVSRINLNQIDQSSNVLSGYSLLVSKPINSHLNQYCVPTSHKEKRKTLLSTNACQENEEQSTHRIGDVKLFGQILTKSNSSLQEIETRSHSPKQKKTRASIDQSSLEEVPLQSYGHWDGTRIQTGFSKLPESAITLSSAGTRPFFSAKDNGVSSSNSNGAITNYQEAFVPPLSSNGKRSGFELVSGFQQGRRTAMARIGVNLVGGNGASDPATALKMAKLYTGEVESWARDLNGG